MMGISMHPGMMAMRMHSSHSVNNSISYIQQDSSWLEMFKDPVFDVLIFLGLLIIIMLAIAIFKPGLYL